ncbi:MAG TPA: hypothetical protein VK743_10500, partial [Steroidobacteraceae bacterium]|nr:hypothetical protein [Steroidobacteraceae bacterium]
YFGTVNLSGAQGVAGSKASTPERQQGLDAFDPATPCMRDVQSHSAGGLVSNGCYRSGAHVRTKPETCHATP